MFGVPSITAMLALCELIKVESICSISAHLTPELPRTGVGTGSQAALSAEADDTWCQCVFISWTLRIRRSPPALRPTYDARCIPRLFLLIKSELDNTGVLMKA